MPMPSLPTPPSTISRRTFIAGATGIGAVGAAAALRPWQALIDAANRNPLPPGPGCW
jgi:hypothetical protein